MADRFCARCGARFVEDARFCAGCGTARSAAANARVSFSLQRYAPLVVVVAVAVAGGSAILGGRLWPVSRPAIVARQGRPGAAPAGDLPPNHPPLTIPQQVKDAIAKIEAAAKKAPADADRWRHFAEVAYRAAQIEPEYLAMAEDAYRHLLELAPGDLTAMRGLGNIAFDREKPQEAIAIYQRYLEQKPDDLSVKTDLGTMYLSTGDVQRAVRTYNAVLEADPGFFQAHFNLAIAYRTQGREAAAVAALKRARDNAPDEAARAQVERLLAQVDEGGGAAVAAAAATAPATSFREGVEEIFRRHQILASKVQRVDWEDGTHARVYLNDFPMGRMPEEMRKLFVQRMQERIRAQKEAHQVGETVSVELLDFASGKRMETIVE